MKARDAIKKMLGKIIIITDLENIDWYRCFHNFCKFIIIFLTFYSVWITRDIWVEEEMEFYFKFVDIDGNELPFTKIIIENINCYCETNSKGEISFITTKKKDWS
jgi:hypothetical protein